MFKALVYYLYLSDLGSQCQSKNCPYKETETRGRR